MNKITKWFYTSQVGAWYFEFLLWLENKKVKKELEYAKHWSNHCKHQIVVNVVQESYEQGIKQLKNKTTSLVEAKTPAEYDRVLKEIKDLLSFTEHDSSRLERINKLRKVFVYKEKDIRNHTDMAKMIDNRIKDFQVLRLHKERRDLMRTLRKAEQQGDEGLAEELKNKIQRIKI